ncbi:MULTISPECIES: T9SS type A sorting domain-containing protein [unclassified Maribacter]|uniref:T9SS type A sorting domain-containing protein n=1 Tax=unclassified Maribacter TaxID=2615042 RepID=UPI002580433C|nr:MULTISPECIES: T9SS type A sorting domain-containing protein [unclassified Maribacter]|tara:strand:- start:115261 stop:116580 length:1320 start_codon:yes stop_codon:yes gene_type:complete
MKKILLLSLFLVINIKFTFSQHYGEDFLNSVDDVEHYINGGQLTRNKSKQAFRNIKILSEKGNADALCLMGVLYKDGIGTGINFNKARKYFKESYEAGSDKGSYSLGYLYLKGLGNINQDYSKAIKWFERSNYPMAKHWLAKMHYFGLGFSVDRNRAVEILSNNPIGNSQLLLKKFQYEMSISETSNSLKITPEETFGDIQLVDTNNYYSTIKGNWVGEWQFFDWSNQKLNRRVPFAMEILDNDTGILDVNITVDDNVFNGKLLQVNNELIFSDLTVDVKKEYTDYIDELQLTYQLTSLIFNLINTEEERVIIGELESTIINWSEPSPPSRLILKQKESELDIDVLKALSEQTEHFIKVYPNPFKEDLLLYYSLEHDSEISVQLYDYYNPTKAIKTKNRNQKKGERTITLDGLHDLEKGLYLVNMNVGSDRYTRIVIKD